MSMKRIVALFLAFMTAMVFLCGCRDKKAEEPVEEPADQEEIKEETTSNGLVVEDEEEPMIIEIPEGQEMGGD